MSDERVRRPRWLVAIAASLGLAVGPPGAEAHLVTTGLGPVYDGLLHLALTPEDLLPALALSLLAGLRGPAHGRCVLLVLPTAWLLGGVLGLAVQGTGSPLLTSLSLVLLGSLVALDAGLPLGATTALAALLGLSHGYLDGMALASPGAGALALLGSAAAVFGVVALATSFVVPLRAAWARVFVRVAGSWIAAIGLLLIGWALRSDT